ncbi:MAG TPA: extracellular solute-binding protein [Firmicutes bacterium]|nr:extracellular solute-binding protein [Bacillota bacterium]
MNKNAGNNRVVKPVASLVMVMILTLSLTVTAFAAARVTLNVAMEAGRMADAAKSVVPEFEKLHPDIKVNVVPLPYTTMQQKVMTELTAKSGAYDIIESHFLMNVPFVAGDLLLPLDKFIKESNVDFGDFVKSMADQTTLAGKASKINPKGSIYGLPYNSDVMMFIYRVDLYKKYGLGVPKDWRQAVNNILKINGSEKGVYGFVFSGARTDNSHAIFDFYNIALNLGGTLPINDEYSPRMNTPGNLEALKILYELVNKYKATPPGVEEYRYAEKNTAIAQGRAAHMTQWMLSCVKSLEDPSESRVSGKIGYAAMPGGKAISGGWTVSIVGTTKHPKEAFEFIKFLTNKKNNLKLALEFGNGPVRKSVILDPEFKKAYPFAQALLEGLEGGVNIFAAAPDVAVWPELTDIVNFALTDGIFGRLSPQDALVQADKKLKDALHQAGYVK